MVASAVVLPGSKTIKPLFSKGQSPSTKLGIFAVSALFLAFIYSFTSWLDPIKHKVSDLVFPIYWLTDIPAEMGDWVDDRMLTKQELLQENEALKTELAVHKRKLQQLATLRAENSRLRQLLNSADTIDDRVLVAELIGVSPNPSQHKVMINRGASDGVYEGQPVVDANGLLGQVVEVGQGSSMVLLITDTSHALPVQVIRNGLRLVAEGQGNLMQLKLRHVSSTMDLKEGDELVSSGLGQRFPAGYPVAVVEKIEYDPGRPFAKVTAKPKAELNRNRHMLLVFEHARVAATEANNDVEGNASTPENAAATEQNKVQP